jgi:DNA primase
VLIATLVNHPALLAENAEELAELELSGRDTDRLRRALLDLAGEGEAAGQELDTVEIRSHLRHVAEGSQLDAVLNREIYRLWPFAEPAATVQDARDGLRHLLDLYRARWAVQETKEEGRRLAEAMDQEHLARLTAKQRAVQAGDGRQVDLDAGEARRPIDPGRGGPGTPGTGGSQETS